MLPVCRRQTRLVELRPRTAQRSGKMLPKFVVAAMSATIKQGQIRMNAIGLGGSRGIAWPGWCNHHGRGWSGEQRCRVVNGSEPLGGDLEHARQDLNLMPLGIGITSFQSREATAAAVFEPNRLNLFAQGDLRQRRGNTATRLSKTFSDAELPRWGDHVFLQNIRV